MPPMPQTPGRGQTRTEYAQAYAASNDDSGSGAEAPVRRRLQKSASTNFPSNYTNYDSSNGVTGPRTGGMNRRRMSIRDQKVPQGPRPQETSRWSKPGPYIHSGNSSVDSTLDSTKSFNLRSTSVGNLAKANPDPDNSENADFLAPVNFDDFQNSILGEPTLNHFPMPGSTSSGENRETGPTHPWESQNYANNVSERTRGPSVRRKSEVQRPNGQTVSTGLTASSANTRARRQSLAQPSAGTTSRAPRKSISSGAFAPTNASARRASLSARKINNDTAASNNLLRPRLPDSDVKVSSVVRNLKAKSFQPSPREPRGPFLTTSGIVDHTRSNSTNAVRSPVRNNSGAVAAPSSTSKRASLMPPHATGLGARTISPTDARRAKRMSIAPPAPPMPHTPPTQTESLPIRPLSSNQSPSQIPRKSVTPSSNRTTPDPTRKSYSSGLSVSSSTSYNSARNSGSTLQTRLSQNLSSSRLPTPKPRTEQGNSNGEEVPPVPAIPKAYESPKGELDAPVFPAPRKSSIPVDLSLLNIKDTDSDAHSTVQVGTRDPVTKTPEPRTRNSTVLAGRKGLQPLKLPP
ncbi:hypothetical protein N7457_005909 [Penicillium paradoxum]|uniref:uncharacterized protein n=1 Tax=Penicillium paradoxum TaxID=176176 RepID=UPI002546F459|nr:uncharacterized protein N7457_005909 [Penicillium paradoxum]KAJ5780749.1 hypothetical protein N7457_005909 [Penicillium paradoxum]